MPRIELIDVPLHNPGDPYHFEFDNLPLKALKTRQELINFALDNVIKQMRDAIGTQNTVANRLNQSIDAFGDLKSEAIDEAMHSIESHEDTDNYVRMTKVERDKLALIAPEATNTTIAIVDGETEIDFDSGKVRFESSSSIVVGMSSPSSHYNVIKFDLAFDPAAAHRHFYGLIPEHDNLITPDFMNYKVNSLPSPFINGSLRVYINGVRISDDHNHDQGGVHVPSQEVYVPGPLVHDSWTLMKFTSDPENGTFVLSAEIIEADVIYIDFDIALVS